MHKVVLNRALNKEVKYYGLSRLGLVGASIIGSVVFLRFGLTVSIMATASGYVLSAGFAKSWHSGYLQALFYWHLPSGFMFSGKYLPKSYMRCFA